MTVINIGDGVLTGLETDIKPKPNEDMIGLRYIEYSVLYDKFIMYVCDGIKWISQSEFIETFKNKTIDGNLNTLVNLPGGGGGETNTMTNIGTAGVGVYKQKVGVQFEMKKINAGSSKITVVDDTANNEIDVDIGTNTITDAQIAASGITTRSKLPAQVMYEDEAETITGAKTFLNTTLKQRNPADTFTGTELNPILTADKNLEAGFSSFGNYIAYKRGSDYVAKNLNTRAVDYSGTVAETAIATAIANAGIYGTVEIHGSDTFALSGAFTGFDVLYHQQIIMGHGTRISLPTGYSGSVFKLYESNSVGQVQIFGGMIQELTTPSRLWTAFDINSTSTGGAFNIQIYGTRIYAAGKGINFRTDTNGWSNANVFLGIYFDTCKVAAEWTHTGTYTDGASGVNNNTFIACTHQADANTTHGFKDIHGRRNQFINCYIADFTGAQITANITANAKWTKISGGSVTALNFTDLSPAGFKAEIDDAYEGNVARTRKSWSYEDGVAIAAPASPSTGTVRQYTKTLDANNDGRFYKARINGAVVEVQI